MQEYHRSHNSSAWVKRCWEVDVMGSKHPSLVPAPFLWVVGGMTEVDEEKIFKVTSIQPGSGWRSLTLPVKSVMVINGDGCSLEMQMNMEMWTYTAWGIMLWNLSDDLPFKVMNMRRYDSREALGVDRVVLIRISTIVEISFDIWDSTRN